MIKKTLAAIASLVILFVLVGLWSYSGAIASIETPEKVVALTYDDGPSPQYTQDLLAVLERQKVRSTFFLKARNVEAFPELAVRVRDAGHEIGNHSYYHYPMYSLSKSKMLAEISRASDIIETTLGIRPKLFRPPYGIQGPGLKLALQELDMPSILMNSIGSDWKLTEARAIADEVLGALGPGSIILLHDGHGDVDDPRAQESRAASVAATDIVINELRGQGYRFVTVGELLELQQEQ